MCSSKKILEYPSKSQCQNLANIGKSWNWFHLQSAQCRNSKHKFFFPGRLMITFFFPIGHCINPANQSGACHFQQAFEVFVCNIQTVVSCLWAFCLRLQRITIRAIFSTRGHSKAEFFKEFLTNHIITVVYLPLIFLQCASAV